MIAVDPNRPAFVGFKARGSEAENAGGDFLAGEIDRRFPQVWPMEARLEMPGTAARRGGAMNGPISNMLVTLLLCAPLAWAACSDGGGEGDADGDAPDTVPDPAADQDGLDPADGEQDPVPDAQDPIPDDPAAEDGLPPEENSGDILCRHLECSALDPDVPEEAAALAAGYAFGTEGRREGPGGQCGEVAVSFFVTLEACEAVRFLPLPSAHFYGNRGTWGSLGLDDTGTMLPDVDAVVARFDELCSRARLDTGLGGHLRCGADLIGYAPTGYLPVTQSVAERLIAEHDARITIDIRTRGDLSFGEVQSIVQAIFSGTSGIVDNAFLDAHPLGLSLDYEPQIVDGDYTAVSAATANAACGVHRDLMTARGHDPDELWCFLYEFGRPTMMADGENLDPWVFPVLMTATMGATGDGDTPEEVQAALELKESWIDNVAAEYAATDVTGCMFFLVPYLTTTQRDQFTFPQALEAFGDKCSVYSFQ